MTASSRSDAPDRTRVLHTEHWLSEPGRRGAQPSRHRTWYIATGMLHAAWRRARNLWARCLHCIISSLEEQPLVPQTSRQVELLHKVQSYDALQHQARAMVETYARKASYYRWLLAQEMINDTTQDTTALDMGQR